MPSTQKPEGIQDPTDPGPVPGGAQEGVEAGDVQDKASAMKSLRSLKSPLNPFKLSYKVFGLSPRPCQWLMGPLVLRYRFSP